MSPFMGYGPNSPGDFMNQQRPHFPNTPGSMFPGFPPHPMMPAYSPMIDGHGPDFGYNMP